MPVAMMQSQELKMDLIQTLYAPSCFITVKSMGLGNMYTSLPGSHDLT